MGTVHALQISTTLDAGTEAHVAAATREQAERGAAADAELLAWADGARTEAIKLITLVTGRRDLATTATAESLAEKAALTVDGYTWTVTFRGPEGTRYCVTMRRRATPQPYFGRASVVAPNGAHLRIAHADAHLRVLRELRDTQAAEDARGGTATPVLRRLFGRRR